MFSDIAPKIVDILPVSIWKSDKPTIGIRKDIDDRIPK